MTDAAPPPRPTGPEPLWTDDGELNLGAVLRLLRARWRVLFFGPLAVAVVTYGLTHLIPPTFTASTVILPPAQSSSSSLAALAGQLGGALGGLAGAAAGIKNPGDQYVALLRSRNVADRILERFQLKQLYAVEFQQDARRVLEENVRIRAGAKDGLITIEVDDQSPQRAADMANAFVDELRRMTREFAVGEASQRRAFFEGQVKQVREALATAERELGSSGITEEALKAAPAAAVEALARVKAQVAAQQVKIASMRGFVSEDNPDLRQAETELNALQFQQQRIQARTESDPASSSGYSERYRDFKYNQILFELVVQQFEMARLDEAREGSLIQVIDQAQLPERKSKPKRMLIAAVSGLISGLIFISIISFYYLSFRR
jgi:uncharacterized protein involved in exopolysaccharide biosynthesis